MEKTLEVTLPEDLQIEHKHMKNHDTVSPRHLVTCSASHQMDKTNTGIPPSTSMDVENKADGHLR